MCRQLICRHAKRRQLTCLRLALLCAFALPALVPSGVAATNAAPPPNTFVSLVPACACGHHTELDLFSLTSGREIRELTSLPHVARANQVALAPATVGGRLFLTVSQGARCDEPKHEIFMECPRWLPGSCRSAVETLSPGQKHFVTAFTVPGSDEIADVVPDPAGNEVALTMTACVSIHGSTGLFIRGLRSGHLHTVSSSGNRCDAYGPTAWNSAGNELAFVLSRAGGKPMPMAGGMGCPEGRVHLALASTNQSSRQPLKLIDPDRGCVFGTVAFDGRGVVATEGCNRDSPPNEGGGHLGQAMLVQYAADGRVLTRKPLKPGLSGSELAPLHDGTLLVTQHQPASSGYAPRDWVWEFDGYRLRRVASYRAQDAGQILAIPW